MKLTIKNVGRINKAEIDINGITVICGDNDTGKSTVGKLLYCIYASLYDIPESIRKEKQSSIMKSAYRYTYFYRLQDYEKARRIIDNLLADSNLNEETIRNALNALPYNKEEVLLKEPEDIVVNRIKSYLTVSDEDIVTAFLQRSIKSEFGGKLANVNTTTQKADVLLEIKNNIISFHTSGKTQKLTLDHYFSLEKRLIYIDDPFILDEVSQPSTRRIGGVQHREDLINLIQRSIQNEPENVIEEIARNTRIQEMIKKIREISDGSLVFEEGEFKYNHIGLKENICLASVSTGIKTFAILRSLLERGYLEENGIMVMDEPEVHLHPAWQMRLAEIAVLLQKAFGLNLVITTHSMDFLTAIDYYSKKYDIREKCQFYLSEVEKPSKSGDFPSVTIKNVTGDLEKVYASISAPYLKVYGEMEGD